MTRVRIVAAVTAVLGLVGLGLTMLPLISFGISKRLLVLFGDEGFLTYMGFGESTSPADYWRESCQLAFEHCDSSSGVQVDVTGYDVIASGYTAGAVIPIVLAFGVAVGALHAWRGRDPRVFTFLSLATATALFVLLFTWMNPSATFSGTGELGQVDTEMTQDTGSDMTMSVGPGLYLPAVILTVMFALATWQAVAASNLSIRSRPRPQNFQMSAPPASVGG
ncbi:hypothetical protein L5G32_17215 [Gordonia sp. HY002]|uniref:hypothetical protein n=1 Tax=Gordonia zhenghanii TaxID=2911516 RepID=UPI001EF14028|nr:hypothetical protein [Gordonia zhenghanii]MCF8572010.1 hypothetical protein [Gordonia zhenghanii]MCF8606641.1 hypothetical protein [Gordonia zhenghanii]